MRRKLEFVFLETMRWPIFSSHSLSTVWNHPLRRKFCNPNRHGTKSSCWYCKNIVGVKFDFPINFGSFMIIVVVPCCLIELLSAKIHLWTRKNHFFIVKFRAWLCDEPTMLLLFYEIYFCYQERAVYWITAWICTKLPASVSGESSKQLQFHSLLHRK